MHCETSRKRNLVKHIAIRRASLNKGMSLDELVASTKGYMRKTLAELQEIDRQEQEIANGKPKS